MNSREVLHGIQDILTNTPYTDNFSRINDIHSLIKNFYSSQTCYVFRTYTLSLAISTNKNYYLEDRLIMEGPYDKCKEYIDNAISCGECKEIDVEYDIEEI